MSEKDGRAENHAQAESSCDGSADETQRTDGGVTDRTEASTTTSRDCTSERTRTAADRARARGLPPRPPLRLRRTSVRLTPNRRAPGDGLLLLDNGVQVTVNREEFARRSPFFRAAFFGNFTESRVNAFEVTLVKPANFFGCCALLRQIGTTGASKLELTWMSFDTAFQLLDAAAFLAFDQLLDPISEVVIDTVDACTLVIAFRKSENRYRPLAKKLWRMMTVEFDKLVKNGSFLSLNADEMLLLLQNPSLNVSRSTEADMLRTWLEKNEGEPSKMAELRANLALCTGAAGAVVDERLRPRIPNIVLIASGGWSPEGPTTQVETLNIRSQSWVPWARSIFDQPRAYHGVLASPSYLYTLGGFNGRHYFNTVGRFDLNTLEWEELSPMYERRCYVSCGFLDKNRIIAIGGHNGLERLRTVESYNTTTNQWTLLSSLRDQRSDGHCVTINGIAYAIGGFDGVSCHASAEFYDANSNRWFEISDAMHSRRSGVAAATMHGGIFVCGGFNGMSRLQTCELIDPREGSWHRFRSMRRRRSNHGMEVINNELVVAGGFGGEMTVSDVESYDIRAGRWASMPSLNLRRSALYLTRVELHDIIGTLLNTANSTANTPR